MLDLNSDLNTLAKIIVELILGTTYQQVEESYVSFLGRVEYLRAATHLQFNDMRSFVTIIEL